MTERKDELDRLFELYPDMVGPLLDADYSLVLCQAPDVFINPSYGKTPMEHHVFRKIVYDKQEMRRFPAFTINAVITDVRDVSGFGLVGVVYSAQLFMDVPANLYIERLQNRNYIFPEDAEDAFAQGALLTMHNNTVHTVRRRSKYYTKEYYTKPT